MNRLKLIVLVWHGGWRLILTRSLCSGKFIAVASYVFIVVTIQPKPMRNSRPRQGSCLVSASPIASLYYCTNQHRGLSGVFTLGGGVQ